MRLAWGTQTGGCADHLNRRGAITCSRMGQTLNQSGESPSKMLSEVDWIAGRLAGTARAARSEKAHQDGARSRNCGTPVRRSPNDEAVRPPSRAWKQVARTLQRRLQTLFPFLLLLKPFFPAGSGRVWPE
jgi:hypothetical protein